MSGHSKVAHLGVEQWASEEPIDDEARMVMVDALLEQEGRILTWRDTMPEDPF